jgi:hypothetical protein
MEKEEWKDGELINPSDEQGGRQPGAMVKTGEWETVNKANAIWSARQERHHPEQYDEFYKQISHDFEAPLAHTHNRVEGSTEYTQLLYIPGKAPMDLWNRDKKGGLKLYVKRVFIMDDAEACCRPTCVLSKVWWTRRPAAEREPRVAAGKPRRESHPRRLHQARAGHAGRPGQTRQAAQAAADGVTDVLSAEEKPRPKSQRRQIHQVLRRVWRGAQGRPGRRLCQQGTPGQAAAFCQQHHRHVSVAFCRLQGAHERRPGGHLLHHRRQPWPPPRTARSSKCSRKRASKCC